MALIRTGVARYTVNGTYLGVPTANIVDLYCSPLTPGEARDEVVENLAGVVLDAWCEYLLPVMMSAYSITSVSWVDLASADGTTGSLSSTGTNTLPQAGALTGQAYSGAIAILVDKQTTSRRGEKAGRMFLPPCGESDIEGNTIGAPYLAALNTALEELHDALNPSTDPVAVFKVVHVGETSTASSISTVTGLVARAKVTTQRRRLGAS